MLVLLVVLLLVSLLLDLILLNEHIKRRKKWRDVLLFDNEVVCSIPVRYA